MGGDRPGMMSLEMLPAGDGDCLLLSYCDNGKRGHVLVDGGRDVHYPALRSRLERLHGEGGRLELLVCTHFDADHIGGLVELAADTSLPLAVDEIWFNGFDQVASAVPMGPRQADDLSDLMRRRGWQPNLRFGGGPAMVAASGSVTHELAGGLRLTLLSPDWCGLQKLLGSWDEARAAAARRQQGQQGDDSSLVSMSPRGTPPAEIRVAALAGGQERPDRSVANGSSIAFLAEHDGKRLLVAGDAHPAVLADSIKRLDLGEGGRLRVDLLKVSHHGSLHNTTRELAGLVDCRRFAFSTDGSRHDHPAPEAVAKLLGGCAAESRELYFNYRQPWTECWNQQSTMDAYRYSCGFPAAGKSLLVKV